MLLKPKSRKFKKHHYYGVSESVKSPKLVYGRYGLVCKEGSLVTSSQLNGWVMTSKRALRRKGKLWCRVFPHIPVTKKPLEVRMGKGKGNVDHWCTRVFKGTVLLEVECGSVATARKILSSVVKKIPFRVGMVERSECVMVSSNGKTSYFD